MTAHQKFHKTRNKEIMRRFHHRLYRLGWTYSSVWMPVSYREGVRAYAKRLGISVGSVLRTCLEIGLKKMTTSELIATERRWRELVGDSAPVLIKKGILKVSYDRQAKHLKVERVA